MKTLIEIHAKVGDDVTDVVRVPGVVLHHYAHDTADKLDIRSESSKGAEDCRHAEFRMIETFAEHLDLDDAIERPVAQRRQDLGLLILCLLAVDDLSTEPALPVERSDISCMINRAGDGYELMLSAALP